MAFNKKKKRKITVNENEFYWSATGNDGWITLTVMADVQGASKLICHFGYHQIPVKLENHLINAVALTNQFVITPYTVRQVIEYALSQNWQPFEKGKILRLGSMDDKIDLRLDKNRADNFKK